MEGIKEKGFFRKFLEWLRTPDEDELVDGELNIKAFSEEDAEILAELNRQSKKTEQMGKEMFSKEEKRKEKVKSLKYDVKKPNVVNKEEKEVEIENSREF